MKLEVRTVEGEPVGEIHEDLSYELDIPERDRPDVIKAIRHGEAKLDVVTGEDRPEDAVTPPEEFVRYKGREALERVQHALKYSTPYRAEVVDDGE